MSDAHNSDDRKSPWAAAASSSQAGLHVRLFGVRDIAALAAIARKPLARGAKPEELARDLNLAFFGAYMSAEQARVELAPAELRNRCETIAFRASELLQALELPTEPRSYTREDALWRRDMRRDPFRGSGIGARLKLAASLVEPLTRLDLGHDRLNTDLSEFERRMSTAILAAPLTDRMVPVSIAELSKPYDDWKDSLFEVASNVGAHQSLEQTEAWLAVQWLLEAAPSAIVLLIALADQVAQEAAQMRAHKQNYRRTFRWMLFHWLARAYFHSFRTAPDVIDSIREPGPATAWVQRVLRLAANRCERIAVIKQPGHRIVEEHERQRLIGEIRAVAELKALQNSFGAGWRLFRQDRPDLASRKSR
jgi:hypothetical protein